MNQDEKLRERYENLKLNIENNASDYVKIFDLGSKENPIIEALGIHIPMPDPIPNIDIPLDVIVNPINTIIDGINNTLIDPIISGIDEMIARMIAFGNGFAKMGNGLFVKEPTGLGNALSDGFKNIGELLKWTGEFIFSYITCGVKFVSNLKQCIWPYLLDCFGQTVYIPFRIILWATLTFLKYDLYPIEKRIWGNIFDVDDKIYGFFGFRLTDYPKNVRDLCYNCKRLKSEALKDKAAEINYLLQPKTVYYNHLDAGFQEMKDGAAEINNSFGSKFYNPNPNWPINKASVEIPRI